jgi:hypothetical protein
VVWSSLGSPYLTFFSEVYISSCLLRYISSCLPQEEKDYRENVVLRYGSQPTVCIVVVELATRLFVKWSMNGNLVYID